MCFCFVFLFFFESEKAGLYPAELVPEAAKRKHYYDLEKEKKKNVKFSSRPSCDSEIKISLQDTFHCRKNKKKTAQLCLGPNLHPIEWISFIFFMRCGHGPATIRTFMCDDTAETLKTPRTESEGCNVFYLREWQ